jgi:hypothetical protein
MPNGTRWSTHAPGPSPGRLRPLGLTGLVPPSPRGAHHRRPTRSTQPISGSRRGAGTPLNDWGQPARGVGGVAFPLELDCPAALASRIVRVIASRASPYTEAIHRLDSTGCAPTSRPSTSRPSTSRPRSARLPSWARSSGRDRGGDRGLPDSTGGAARPRSPPEAPPIAVLPTWTGGEKPWPSGPKTS